MLAAYLALGLALAACALGAPPVTPAPTIAATPLPSPTPTARPTPTDLPPLAVLLAPQGANPAWVGALQPRLAESAEKAGLRFQVRPSLSAAELGQLKVALVLPPDPGLAALAAAAPQAQFLAVGIPGIQPGSNLSVVGGGGDRPDQAAFLAGYTAAMLVQDWRTGVVTQADTPSGEAMRQGFANGVTYFCGLCLPVYPPFPAGGYPIGYQLPAGAGPADWPAAITYLKSWQVGVVYVDPAVAASGFLAALAEAEINLILAGPPPEELQPRWVASIGAQDPLSSVPEVWETVLQGKGGQQVALPLGFTQVNPDLLSPGKQRLAEEMLADLLAGFIDTGATPQDGE